MSISRLFLTRFYLKSSLAIAIALILSTVFWVSPSCATTLTSQFLSNDPNALQIMGGIPYDMNDPTWLDNGYDQNKNAFAYKLFSALSMLGYQTEMGYNYGLGDQHLRALHVFQSQHDLPVSNYVTSDCLLQIDQLLVQREQALAPVAQGFPLYDHMQPLHANDISKDTLAVIYSMPMAKLPEYLQMGTYELVQCIAGQCNGFIQDSSGHDLSSWPTPIDMSSDYRFVGAYFDPRKNNSRLPSAAVHVDTVLHEYAHYLDGIFPWDKDPLLPHLGLIDTTGFYSISYDMSSGTYCYKQKSSNPKDWVTKYGFNPGYGGCAAGTGVVFEDWAESFSMYVTAGKNFRAAAQQSLKIAQKYDWLKDNIFQGLEFDTDLPRDIESGCNDIYGTQSAQPGYAKCDDNYIWDFTLPLVPADTQPTITTASLPNGVKAKAYSQTLAARGSKTPYTRSVASGALPAGLLLNTSSGVISGTPTTVGAYSFTVRCNDAYILYSDKKLSITINATPTITTASLPNGQKAKAYSQILADNGSDWFFTGATDTRWNDTDLNQLKTVPGNAFEVVVSGSIIR